MKQRTPFRFIARNIMLDELEHCLLHQIQGFIRIAGRDLCHTEGAPLDTGQEPVQCLVLIQPLRPPMETKRGLLVLHQPPALSGPASLQRLPARLPRGEGRSRRRLKRSLL